ncbi:MAG: nuclear transport factor 2 family protein [Rhodanobacter sp.]
MRHGCMQGFMLVAALVATGGVQAAETDTTAIARLSQAFSDASATGDAKTLDRLLDADVVFMGEDGTLSSKHDIVAGASPPPAGTRNTLIQSDFHVALHGDVAVTSFTDNATFVTYGHTAHDSFRSTEVWLRKNGSWKMVSSQTIEMPVEPPHIQLATNELDPYVGSYQLAPGHAMRIERQGNSLVMIGRDNKPVPMLAEVRDILFRAGSPRVRFVFARNTDGRITGFDVRRAGHDLQHFTRS